MSYNTPWVKIGNIAICIVVVIGSGWLVCSCFTSARQALLNGDNWLVCGAERRCQIMIIITGCVVRILPECSIK